MTITKKIIYKPEKPGTYRTIPAGAISDQAAYVFDQPVTFLEQNYIEMINGQFWLWEDTLFGRFGFFLEGKWTDGR